MCEGSGPSSGRRCRSTHCEAPDTSSGFPTCPPPTKSERALGLPSSAMIVVSTGCPAGVGPEVSVQGAAKVRGVDVVLVGDLATLKLAAEKVGVSPDRLAE